MAFVAHTALPLRRARTARTSVRRPRMSKLAPSQSLPTILLDRNTKNRLQRVAALFSQELNRTASLAAAAAVLAAVASNAAPAHAAADPVQMTGMRQETSAAATRSMSSDSSPAPVSNGVQDWRYSQFISAVEKDQVEKVTFSADGQRLLAVDTDGNRFKLDALPNDPDLLKTLTSHKVDVTVLPSQPESGAGDFIRSLIFPALLFGGLFLLSRRAGGGAGGFGPMGGPMDLQRSGARVSMVPETGITFKDVAGVDGAKLELQEVVQFLKESERFTELGAKIPRGVILEGPPGTGKTLLARAVAGEAGVPFFSISGSEFVEMFVGVGASRVRDLFANAKKNAPCIIFIDEIDAVGRQRGAGIAGGNDEREQTLNQMLTEMDGFEGNSGVIVIAATNRADVLDNALLRPGRFDRRVVVDLPDFNGRVSILNVHARGKPLAKDVDMEQVARRTPGFSGAALQNLLNEAAIFTARRQKTEIGQDEISDAIDRITIGAEKKETVMTPERQKLVAYHEAGHAVVGALTPDYDQVAKISIIPRGGAGGLTFFAPNEQRVDSGLYSRQFLEGQLAVALGGRIAEELVFGDEKVTTGASNDLQRVTQVAKQMVTRFGMSNKVGQLSLNTEGSNPFLGRAMASGGPQMSSVLKAEIDDEVRRLVNVAYTRAKSLLISNRKLLDDLAKLLIEKETVSAEEFQRLIAENKIEMMPYAAY
ncbi:ATP-dependent zinc metalloprotease FtsH 3 [Gracilariopsis chorda]|uniref:ATP-dependent zinc metalloprotease FtsH 3 n=1 Tax=Gracilariopsis chorda TaxID=448386 RepID=A0A2V3IKE4_9FLOR|nr:ATP-dependent zinc metalloprotease FtsH 3 [Gracilariopsis chorda]|eukprot:PXF42518.1 ATP-dependent zinc metalloprotease FtsH 3 [Gracilariopsis chorda]